ncbi:MAG TPA: pirin family protein [Paucimonas sp.]|nr:pirin family protein [Paucimonas sp.]
MQLDVRKSHTRGSMKNDWLDAKFSFSFGPYSHPERHHFGVLRALNEDLIQPGTGFGMHPHRDLEILMIPLSAPIEHRDSLGNRVIVRPGEAQKMTAGSGIEHSQMNASMTTIDHHLQIWFTPARRGLPPGIVQGSFPASGRIARWQTIAAPEGRDGALPLNQDAFLRMAILPAGTVLEIAGDAARSAYLHVVRGSIDIRAASGQEARLDSGDALPLTEASDLSLRGGTEESEVLWFDLPKVA